MFGRSVNFSECLSSKFGTLAGTITFFWPGSLTALLTQSGLGAEDYKSLVSHILDAREEEVERLLSPDVREELSSSPAPLPSEAPVVASPVSRVPSPASPQVICPSPPVPTAIDLHEGGLEHFTGYLSAQRYLFATGNPLRPFITTGLTGSISQEEVGVLYALVVADIPSNSKRARPASSASSNAQRWACDYKSAQSLYARDKRRLVTRILAGLPLDSSETSSVRGEDIKQHLLTTFGADSAPDPEPISDPCQPVSGCFSPITPTDIRLTFMSTQPSSPGSENIRKDDLAHLDPFKVSVLFSICVFCAITSSPWKKARTIFVPKTENRVRPGDLRPITITSMVQRVLHKLIARRLGGCVSLCAPRKDFMPEDGLLNNLFVLQGHQTPQGLRYSPYHHLY